MVVSLQFRSSHKKYMLGFCLANLLQSCGKQAGIKYNMSAKVDRLTQNNAISNNSSSTAIPEVCLAEKLINLAKTKDYERLKDYLSLDICRKEFLIETFKVNGIDPGPFAIYTVQHNFLSPCFNWMLI